MRFTCFVSGLVLWALLAGGCGGGPAADSGDEGKTKQTQECTDGEGGECAKEGAHEGDEHGHGEGEHEEGEGGHGGHGEGEGEHDENRVTLSPEARASIQLDTAPVVTEAFQSEIQATGEIRANAYRLAHVSPRIPGKATEVSGELGQHVQPGQSLALLDSLELGERKSAFLRARADLEVARRNYERERRLFDQRISSEREYLEAKGEFERSEAAYQAAREALRLVGLGNEEIDAIRWETGTDKRLSYFPLVAPFAGTIIERHVTIGELVDPEDKPFTIADLTTVWVLLNVFEKDLANLNEGASVRVGVDAYPGETFDGKVLYISRQVDPGTRTAEARIEVANGDGRLRPGMFARAAIASAAKDATTWPVVPRNALQRVRDDTVVFVPAGEGEYEMVKVEVGRESEDRAQILAGLSEGQRVVTEGAFYLKSTILKESMAGHSH